MGCYRWWQLLFFLTASTSFSRAAVLRWVSPRSGYWYTASNWDAGRMPQITDSVIIESDDLLTVYVHRNAPEAKARDITTNLNVTLDVSYGGTLRVLGEINSYGWFSMRGSCCSWNTLIISGTLNIWGRSLWDTGLIDARETSRINVYNTTVPGDPSGPPPTHTWPYKFQSSARMIFMTEVWLARSHLLFGGGSYVVADNGTLHMASGTRIGVSGNGGEIIENRGHLRIHGNVQIGVPFSNYGKLEAFASAQLTLSHQSVLDGNILVHESGALVFSGNNEYVFKSSSEVIIHGSVKCSHGILTVDSDIFRTRELATSNHCQLYIRQMNALGGYIIEQLSATGYSKIHLDLTDESKQVNLTDVLVYERAQLRVLAPAILKTFTQDVHHDGLVMFAGTTEITDMWTYKGGQLFVNSILHVKRECQWTGSNAKYIRRGEIRLYGQSVWDFSGISVTIFDNAIIHNTEAATITIKGKAGSTVTGVTGSTGQIRASLQNEGLIEVTLFPPATFQFQDIDFQNYGVLNVSSAPPSRVAIGVRARPSRLGKVGTVRVSPNNTLVFASGLKSGDNTGKIEVAGSLHVALGDITLNIRATGDSSIVVDNGQLTIESSGQVPNVKVLGGELHVRRVPLITKKLEVLGGRVDIQEHLRVSELFLDGGSISGPGHLVVENSWLWSRGEVMPSETGTAEVIGPFVLKGDARKHLGRNTILKHNSTWTASAIAIYLSATLTVEENVVINSYSGLVYFMSADAGGVLENRGHLNFSLAPVGGMQVFVHLINHGTIDIHEGSLLFGNQANLHGMLRVHKGNLLLLKSHTTLTNYNTLLANGMLKCVVSELTVNGDIGVRKIAVYNSKVTIRNLYGIHFEEIVFQGMTSLAIDSLFQYVHQGLSRSSTLRLVGGKRPNEGRVEIFYAGQWGTICHSYRTTNDAKVVCRQLGFTGGKPYSSARFGQDAGRIWLRYIGCTGQESNVHECPGIRWRYYTHVCRHHHDWSVVCDTGMAIYENVRSESALIIDQEPLGSTHNIDRLHIAHGSDRVTLSLQASANIGELILSGDAELQNNEKLQVENFIWRSGTIVGHEKQGQLSVTRKAWLNFDGESTLSRQQLIFKDMVDFRGLVSLKLQHGALMTAASGSTLNVSAGSARIYQHDVLDGTVELEGTVNIASYLAVSTNLQFSGTMNIGKTAVVTFLECLGSGENAEADYGGSISTTVSGQTCQRWDRQVPHAHSSTDVRQFPDVTLEEAHNFCRLPSTPPKRPWCFTTNRYKRWEECSIPHKCGSVNLNGRVTVVDSGSLLLGANTKLGASSHLEGAGEIRLGTGKLEIPAGKQMDPLVVDHGTVTVYEGGAKEIILNGGRVDIFCKSGVCPSFLLSRITVNHGELAVHTDIKVTELQMNAGRLEVNGKLDINTGYWRQGNVSCAIYRSVSVKNLMITRGSSVTLHVCSLVIEEKAAIVELSQMQMTNAVLEVASAAEMSIAGEFSLKCKNALVKIGGTLKSQGPSDNNLQTGSQSFDCSIDITGHFLLEGTELKLGQSVQIQGTLSTSSSSNLRFGGDKLTASEGSTLKVLGDLIIESGMLSATSISLVEISSLTCLGTCILGDGEVPKLESKGGGNIVLTERLSSNTSISVTDGGLISIENSVSVGYLEIDHGTIDIPGSLNTAHLYLKRGTLKGQGTLDARHCILGADMSIGLEIISLKIADSITIDQPELRKFLSLTNALLTLAEGTTLSILGDLLISGQGTINSRGNLHVEGTLTVEDGVDLLNYGQLRLVGGTAFVDLACLLNTGLLASDSDSLLTVSKLTAELDSTLDIAGKLVLRGDSNLQASQSTIAEVEITGGTIAHYVYQIPLGSITLDGGKMIITGGINTDATVFHVAAVRMTDGTLQIIGNFIIETLNQSGGTVDVLSACDIKTYNFDGGTISGHSVHDRIELQTMSLSGLSPKTIEPGVHIQVDHFAMSSSQLEHHGILTVIKDGKLTVEHDCEISGNGVLVNQEELKVLETNGDTRASLNLGVSLENKGIVDFSPLGTVTFGGYLVNNGDIVFGPNSHIHFYGYSVTAPIELHTAIVVAHKGATLSVQASSTVNKLEVLEGSQVFIYPTSTVTKFTLSELLVQGNIFLLADASVTTCIFQGGRVNAPFFRNVSVTCDTTSIAASPGFSASTKPTIQNTILQTDHLDATSSFLDIHAGQLVVKQFGNFHQITELTFKEDARFVIEKDGNVIFEKNLNIKHEGLLSGSIDNIGVLTFNADANIEVDFSNKGELHVAEGAHVSIRQFSAETTVAGLYSLAAYSSLTCAGHGSILLDNKSSFGTGSSLTVKGGIVFLDTADTVMEDMALNIAGGRIDFLKSGSTSGTVFRLKAVTITSGELRIHSDDELEVNIGALKLEGGLVNNGRLIEVDSLVLHHGTVNNSLIVAESVSLRNYALLQGSTLDVRNSFNSDSVSLTYLEFSQESTLQIGDGAHMSIDCETHLVAVGGSSETLLIDGSAEIASKTKLVVDIDVEVSTEGALKMSQNSEFAIDGSASDIKGKLTCDEGSHIDCKGTSLTIHTTAKVGCDPAAITIGCPIVVESAQVALSSLTVTNKLTVSEPSCFGMMLIKGGDLILTSEHSIGNFLMDGGTFSVSGKTSINGVAKLLSGQITVDAGASLYYNAQVDKDPQVVEVVTGTISVIDFDDPCTGKESCPSCTGDCSWSESSATCIPTSRAGPDGCFPGGCSSNAGRCEKLTSSDLCNLTDSCVWCASGICYSITSQQAGQVDNPIFWSASANGYWNDPANWNLERIPTENDTVFISLSGTYDVTTNGNVKVKKLIVGGVCSNKLCPSKPAVAINHGFEISEDIEINHGSRVTIRGAYLTVNGKAKNGGEMFLSGKNTRFRFWSDLVNYGEVNVQLYPKLIGNVTNYGFFTVGTNEITLEGTIYNKANGTILLDKVNGGFQNGFIVNEGAMRIHCGCAKTTSCSCTHNVKAHVDSVGYIAVQDATVNFYGDVQLGGQLRLNTQKIYFRKTSVILSSASTSQEDGGHIVFVGGQHTIGSPDIYATLYLASVAVLNITVNRLSGTLSLGHGTINLQTMFLELQTLLFTRGIFNGYGAAARVLSFTIPNVYNYNYRIMNNVSLEVTGVLSQANGLTMRANTSITVTESSNMNLLSTQAARWQGAADCLFQNYGAMLVIGSATFNVPFTSTGSIEVASHGSLTLSRNSKLLEGSLAVHNGGRVILGNADHKIGDALDISLDGQLIANGKTIINSQQLGKVGTLKVVGGSSTVVEMTLEKEGNIYIDTLWMYHGTLKLKTNGQLHINLLLTDYGGTYLYLETNCEITTFKASLSYDAFYYLSSNFTYSLKDNVDLYAHRSDRVVRFVSLNDDMSALEIHGNIVAKQVRLLFDSVVSVQHANLHAISFVLYLNGGSNYTVNEGGHFDVTSAGVYTGKLFNFGMINTMQRVTINAYLENHGEIRVDGETSVKDLQNHGNVTVRGGAYFDGSDYRGSHFHSPQSSISFEPGSVTHLRGSVIFNTTEISIHSMFVYSATVSFPGSLDIQQLYVSGGTIDASLGTLSCDSATFSGTSTMRNVAIKVARELNIAGTVYLGGQIQISSGATCCGNRNFHFATTSSVMETGLTNEGTLIVYPQQSGTIGSSLLNEGLLIIAGTLTVSGTLDAVGGQFQLRGHLNAGRQLHLSRDSMTSGDGTVSLSSSGTRMDMWSERSFVPKIMASGGRHTLSINGTASFEHRMSLVASSGIISLFSSSNLFFQSVHLSGYASLSVTMSDETSHYIAELTLRDRCKFIGYNTEIDSLKFYGGTMENTNDGSFLINGTFVMEKGAPKYIRRTLLKLLGLGIMDSDDSISLQKSSVESSHALVIKSATTITGQEDSNVTISGRILIPIERQNLFFRTLQLVNQGQIELAKTSLSVDKFINNGLVVGEGGTLEIRGFDSRLGPSSTLTLTKGRLVVNGNGRLLLETNITEEVLVGMAGKATVPEDVTLVIEEIRMYTGFELHVNGKLFCTRLILSGGTLSGDGGMVSCKDVTWQEGVISIITGNGSSSGLHVTQHLVVTSDKSKVARRGRIMTWSLVTFRESASVTLSENHLWENYDSMAFYPGARMESADSQLVNYGQLSAYNGRGEKPASLLLSIKSVGSIEVDGGALQLGTDIARTSHYQGRMIIRGTLEVVGGQHNLETNSTLIVEGSLKMIGTKSSKLSIYSTEDTIFVQKVVVVSGSLEFASTRNDTDLLSVKVQGGTLILQTPLSIQSMVVSFGQALIRSVIKAKFVSLWAGLIDTNRKQCQLLVETMYWLGGTISTLPGKKFFVDVNDVTFGSYTSKRLENDVKFKIGSRAHYGPSIPLFLMQGSELTIDEEAVFYFASGEIIGPDRSGAFINTGLIEAGVSGSETSTVTITANFQNNGNMNLHKCQLIFKADASFQGSGLSLGANSQLYVSKGDVRLPPDSVRFLTPITVNGGRLLLQGGNYSNYHDITILSGEVSILSDSVSDTKFDGSIQISGGSLNISGVLVLTGHVQFITGTIKGQGKMETAMNASINVAYGQNPSERRTLLLPLLRSSGKAEVSSPFTIQTGALLAVEELSVFSLTNYGNLIGEGRLVNAGHLSIEVNPIYQCQPTAYVDNYWQISVQSGGLLLQSGHETRLKFHDTSHLRGPGITLGTGSTAGGVIEGAVEVTGTVSVKEPLYLSGEVRWVAGGFKRASEPCTSSYNPPYSITIPGCDEVFVMNQDTLIVTDSEQDKYLHTGLYLVNEGNLSWLEGTMHVYSAFYNNPTGVFTVTGPGPHEWSSSQDFHNMGTLVIQEGSTGAVRGKTQNHGRIHLETMSEFYFNTLFNYENGLISTAAGSKLSANAVYLYGGDFKARGDIFTTLVVDRQATLKPNMDGTGTLVVNGTVIFRGDGELFIDIGGLDPEDKDLLVADAHFYVDGNNKLLINWVNGYEPVANETFTLVEWTGSRRSQFKAITDSSGKYTFLATYDAHSLKVTVL